jgi:hypothetical protein
MADWPEALPCYPIEGSFVETPHRNVARFMPEVGPPKFRRRNTANGSSAGLTWKFTKAQLATFLTFYTTELKDGSLPFNMEHPITDEVHSWAFESEPEISSVTRHAHTVSAQLRRLTDVALADINIEELEVE